MDLIKKDITEDQIKGAIGRLKKAGIIAMGYAIIGFPDDTMADLKKTRDKIFDFDPHALQLSFATPLPGSRLYETCVQKDLIATDSWDDYTFLRRSIIRNSSISRGELEELRRGIIKEFYFRPKKIFELSTFLAFTTKPDYLNCFKAFLKIISNIGK